MNVALEALALFAPAGFANMAPLVANKIPYLNRWTTPMDFGRSFKGMRILGNNKTWRGFTSGVIAATAFGALIHDSFFPDTDWKIYLLRCAAIGAGALVGDAVKSFFKRRQDVPPGTSWFPFDQIDYILGGLLFLVPFGLPSLSVLGSIIVIFFGGHVVITYLSYHAGFKDKPI